MSEIRIPATAEAAVAELGSLGRLINARKWERAAVVASLVGPAPGSGARTDLGQMSEVAYPHTPVSLAELGIIGLRNEKGIRYYRDVWIRQRPVPTLGDTVDLDGLPEWPGIPEEELAQQTGMSTERKEALLEAGKAAGMPTGAKVVDVAANPKALAEAIKADPATARVAAEALAKVKAVPLAPLPVEEQVINRLNFEMDHPEHFPGPEPVRSKEDAAWEEFFVMLFKTRDLAQVVIASYPPNAERLASLNRAIGDILNLIPVV